MVNAMELGQFIMTTVSLASRMSSKMVYLRDMVVKAFQVSEIHIPPPLFQMLWG